MNIFAKVKKALLLVPTLITTEGTLDGSNLNLSLVFTDEDFLYNPISILLLNLRY